MEFTLEETEVRVKDEPTDTNVERNPRSEHAEEFIRASLRTQTPSSDDEIDIKYEGSGIDYNSTTSAEGDDGIQVGTQSMPSNMNPTYGTECRINSGQFELGEFYLGLLQCEQDCETCQKYIRELSEHVRATHGECQPTRDPLHVDPLEMGQSSAVEIKCEVDEDIERLDCSEQSNSNVESVVENTSESEPGFNTSHDLNPQRKSGRMEEEESVSDSDHNVESGSENDPDYITSPVFTKGTTRKKTTTHKRSNTAKMPSKIRFKCTVCEKSFTRKDHLDRHMRIHTSEKPYNCHECEKSFKPQVKLISRVRGHPGERPFKCTDIHTGTQSMFANMSPKPGSQRPINSEQIELSEFYLRLLQCEQDCETCQKYIRKLSEHIRVTHAEGQPNRDPLIIDPDQSSAFEIKPEVVEDVDSEESMSNPDYNIESGSDSDPDYAPSPVLTRKVCLPNTNLSRHISTDPTGDKRSGSEGYGKGKATQTGKKQSEMPFKCTGCDKGFTKKCLLTVHVRTHTGEKPFKCNLCLKGFSTKAYATVHMRGHTGDKPFNCDECNKSFLLKCNLDLHMRCHTGERPFKCIVCEKNFSRKLHLEDHVRSHTGEKLFNCDTCLKGFASKSNLTIHLRGHTGDKPFKCDLCRMAFIAKRYLNIHMRGHTANSLKCDESYKRFAQRRKLDSPNIEK